MKWSKWMEECEKSTEKKENVEQQEKNRVKMLLFLYRHYHCRCLHKKGDLWVHCAAGRLVPRRKKKRISCLLTVCVMLTLPSMLYSQWFCFLSFHIVTFTEKRENLTALLLLRLMLLVFLTTMMIPDKIFSNCFLFQRTEKTKILSKIIGITIYPVCVFFLFGGKKWNEEKGW